MTPRPDLHSLSRAAMILSRLLGDPERLDEQEAREAFRILHTLVADANGDFPQDSLEFMRKWNEEVCPSFLTPGGLALEESVYKPWTTDESHPLREEQGLAWGDPAEHMLSLFDMFGLNEANRGNVSPDHLSILLDFLVLLLENRPEEEAVRFCHDHLDWLPELVKSAQGVEVPNILVLALRASESLAELVASEKKRSQP